MFDGNVFIAYSRTDREFVTRLAKELELAGLKVWYDGNLKAGVPWRKVIEERLRASSAVIAVVSKASTASDEVQAELQKASARGVTKLIPLQLEPDAELPLLLINRQHVTVDEVQHAPGAPDGDHRPAVPLARILEALLDPLPPEQLTSISDSPPFHSLAERLMSEARRVVLVGMGLNVLQREPLARKLMQRAAKGDCELEIFLANPGSPAVQTRLIEEELGDTRPPVGRDGLYRRLDTFLGLWESEGRPPSIRIRLIHHYPGFAMIVIDDDYFVYPYGYKTLGNYSPVLRFSRSSAESVVVFLDQQYAAIAEDSVDAEPVLRARRGGPIDRASLHELAVYFVPDARAPLYRFGSHVLGYDVREGSETAPPWPDRVREARPYGFHVTICDALHFLSAAEVAAVFAEVEFLLQEFGPFELTDLSLRSGLPDARTVSVAVEDRSGTLEALHAELVSRVYRRAAASNYTLGLAAADRDPVLPRDRLMLERYRAPYVLQRFTPHMTLLRVPERDAGPEDLEGLRRLWEEHGVSPTVRVERLQLMTRGHGEDRWRIAREVSLRGNLT